jgi:hypothetical protein
MDAGQVKQYTDEGHYLWALRAAGIDRENYSKIVTVYDKPFLREGWAPDRAGYDDGV